MDPRWFSPHATLYDLRELRMRLATLARGRSQSTADILARFDWLDQRLAAIEAHLGILPPPAPEFTSPEIIGVQPSETDILDAIQQLEKESPDPSPMQNDSKGLT